MERLQGIAVSPGVAIGEALVMDNEGFRIPRRFVPRDAVDDELERLDQAIAAAAAEIARNRDRVAEQLGEKYGAIFSAHLQMLHDPRLRGEAGGDDPPAALLARVRRQPRAAPLRQGLPVARRRLPGRAGQRHLRHREARCCGTCWAAAAKSSRTSPRRCWCWPTISRPAKRPISIRKFVRGFVTEIGGPGSHTAIVAEALGIPAVVGTGPFLTDVSGGETVIIDGDQGLVILQPDEETLARYRHEVEQHRIAGRASSKRSAICPPKRPTACASSCWATSSFPYEVEHCVERGADGIGLYRTEFLFLGARRASRPRRSSSPPTPTSPQAMGEQPVVIRTFDLGADKMPNMPAPEDERNPFLGLRSIRLALQASPTVPHAAAGDPAGQRARATFSIMFPLVTTLLELRQAKMVLADAMEDLDEEGVAVQPRHAGRHDGRGARRP